MSEEKPVVEDQILTQLSRLDEKLEVRFNQIDQRFHALETQFGQRLSRLEGGFEQMDKRMGDLNARMSSAESLQRWAIGLIATSWLTLAGLSLTVLFKLP